MKARVFLMLFLFTLAGCGQPRIEPSASTEPAPGSNAKAVYPAFLPPPTTSGEFQGAACPFALPDDLQQGEDVDCGYLTVREQRDEATSSGRLIRLAVAIFHPPGGATRPDPVIYLSGGPGGSALEVIRYQYEFFSAPVFAAGRDLVVFDQRGVGVSQPALDCPDFDEGFAEMLDREVNGRQVNEDEVMELLLKNLLSCRDELAQIADLTAYNSAASADDVHDLTQALGWDKVNLWGGSYGTRLALEVMRRHPERLRSVVLDAVYPPDVDLYQLAPGNFNRALEKLFTSCAENPVCSREHPDLRQVFFSTVHSMNENPVLFEVTNPFTWDEQPARMNGDTLLALTFQLLYNSKLRYLLPRQIYASSEGDYTAFEQIYGSLIALQSISSRGMMFSVQCHEEIPFSSPQEFEAEMERYPELGGMYENGLLGGLSYKICQEWGAGRADNSANQPVSSDVPTLLMSGEFDPITPPDWGRHAAETLENGYFTEYPGIGHGASVLPGCPSEMFTAFLENPFSEPDGACIQEMMK